MDELQIFENTDFGKIRTYKEPDGSVTFCGADVAMCLGYSDTSKAIKQHCKSDGWAFHPVIDNLGRTQQAKFITKGNLCRLAAKSELPGAEKFESWIFDEVIPSVLEHGLYAVDQLLDNPDLAIQAFTALKEERAKTARLNSKVKELKPKADYCTKILDNPGLIPITSIAKDYGMSGQEFNKRLHEFGIQYKRGSQWFLYEKYQACGYVSSKPVPITHSDGTKDVKPQTKWTQKGRKFLYDFLKEQGVLPVIEKEPFVQVSA